MTNSIDFILTAAASDLMSKALSGKTLNFTRMAVGDGFSYDTNAAKNYTALVNEVLSLDITKVETSSFSSVRVTSAFKNTDAEKEFYYREVGLYAQDPDTGIEILYAYGNRNDAAELIIPTGSSVISKQLNFIISVGDSAKVTFNVNAGVYALQEDLTTLQANLHELNSTKANQTSLNETNSILAQKADKTEITNVMTPKGTCAYASLPTTGNTIGWYYYCPDGDTTNGKGNYVWNGSSWYFGGTGDEGYNIVKNELSTLSNDYYNHIYKKILWTDYTNTNYKISLPNKIYNGDTVKVKVVALSAGWIEGFFANGNTKTSLGFTSKNVVKGETIVVEGISTTSLIDNFWIGSAGTVTCEVWISCDSWAVNGKIAKAKSNIDSLWSGVIDLAKYKTQAFSVGKNEYSNDTVIIHHRRIKSGDNVKLRVVVKGEGYLKAIFRFATTECNISVSSSYAKYGDVLTAEGIASTDFDSLIIYSTASVPCEVYIYDNDWKSREIVVDKDGFGDFTDLDEALKNANDNSDHPVVIKVRAGTYHMRTETPEDIPYKKTNRYLVIIGEDRNNCIIRNDNGYYSPYTDDSNGLLFDSAPLRLSGNITIENITIISTDTNYRNWCDSESRVKGVGRDQSYCIHSDFDCDEHTTSIIRNCRLVNNHYCCIGCGTRKNHKIQVENCELETTINSENTDNGAFFVHSFNLNSGNSYEGQEVVAKNNIIVNKNGVKSCYFYASSPDRIYATLIGNVSKTSDTKNGFISYGNAYGVTKTDLCFGNNITSMNT